MGKGRSNNINSPLLPEFSGDEAIALGFKLIIVYGMVTLQWLLTLAVGITAVSNSQIPQFVFHTPPGLAIYIITAIIWGVATSFPLVCVPEDYWWCWLGPRYWVSYILTPIVIGLSCSYSEGIGLIGLETTILMSVAGIVITIYTCAVPFCFDYELKGATFVALFFVICVYGIIQIVHPLTDFWSSLASLAAGNAFCIYMQAVGNKVARGDISGLHALRIDA